jgi:hypothetical protein
MLCSCSAFGQEKSDFYNQPAQVGDKFLGLRSYLFRVAERCNISLIIARDVRARTSRVQGKTVKEALNNYLHDTGFTYRLRDNCLYVAEAENLKRFFEKLPEDTLMLPRGKGNITVSGIFPSIEISVFCKILRNLTGVEIRASDNLKDSLMIRLLKMPWQTVLIAIARLNNYKLLRSEFSVLITEP